MEVGIAHLIVENGRHQQMIVCVCVERTGPKRSFLKTSKLDTAQCQSITSSRFSIKTSCSGCLDLDDRLSINCITDCAGEFPRGRDCWIHRDSDVSKINIVIIVELKHLGFYTITQQESVTIPNLSEIRNDHGDRFCQTIICVEVSRECDRINRCKTWKVEPS